MLRVVLVSSEITYVPDNYASAFETILEKCPGRIVGLFEIKIRNAFIILNLVKLICCGCFRIFSVLMRNTLSRPFQKRHRLFSRNGASVTKIRSMNDPKAIQWIHDQSIDLIINMRTRDIYRGEILTAPRIACVNVHHGILPKYRGLLCDAYALAAGREPGFSIHQMTAKIDDGGIISTHTVAANAPPIFTNHVQRSSELEGIALAKLIMEIEQLGSLPAMRQNITDLPVKSKSPTWRELRRMKASGLRL
jgi:methionyl-tRNA formyltransferase